MKRNRQQQGSTLVMALVTIAVAAFLGGSVFYIVGNRYQTSFHSSSWQEALFVAESGVDTGMTALNASLTSPSTAWTGWTPSDATTFPKTYAGTFPAHAGDGNNKMYVSVTVDNSVKDGNGNVWYRIRSKGTTELPGLHRVGYEPSVLSSTGTKSHKNFLRKLSFNTDVTAGALHTPQVTRSVETLAQPLSASLFTRAMLVQNSVSMSGNAYTDSFDSTDPTKSTNGQYDQAKRQKHGDVATNSSGNSSDLKNAYVYGNASSNSGVIQDTQHVQGSVYNNFSATISSVSDPSFASYNSSPSTINGGNTTLTAGTQAAPANFVVSAMSLSAANSLTLAPPSPGQESYINIWVKGDITMSGGGFIKQLAGVHATIWVDGNVTVSGSAFDNENGYASYLQINGVTPSDGSTNTFVVTGNGTFVGVVNAPSYALTISGNGDFMGALIVLSATLSGNAGYHYDESLGKVSGGNGQGFKVASWIEHIK
jgi:Tfp pilus assembly protein PilX